MAQAKTNQKNDREIKMNRRAGKDRRTETDRRQKDVPVKVERRKLERREKVSRRRQIDPTTCEREYSTEEIEFMQALDAYKRSSGRMFPTCSEILEVIHNLGYEKRPRGDVQDPTRQADNDSQPVVAEPDVPSADPSEPTGPAA